MRENRFKRIESVTVFFINFYLIFEQFRVFHILYSVFQWTSFKSISSIKKSRLLTFFPWLVSDSISFNLIGHICKISSERKAIFKDSSFLYFPQRLSKICLLFSSRIICPISKFINSCKKSNICVIVVAFRINNETHE